MVGTRERLLSTTTALIQRQGLNGTSMKEIVEAAGATTGSLYHFFPGGKDQLAEEVIRTSGAMYLELFRLATAAAADTVEAISLLFEGAAATLEASDYVDACPIFTVAHEVASADDALRQACDTVFAEWTTHAAAIFRDSGMNDLTAHDLATTVIAALGGAFIVARTAKRADLMRATGRHVTRLIRAACPTT